MMLRIPRDTEKYGVISLFSESTNIICWFLDETSKSTVKKKETDKKEDEGIPGIPFFNALNSGNFSSTTTEKSSFQDQYSGGDFEISSNTWNC